MIALLDQPHAAESRPMEAGIAQFLDLAATANVTFHLVGDRLAMRCARADWHRWQVIRHYLDEIGLDAMTDYFRRTTPEEREALSRAA